ncbi:thiamine-phosphate kinase [Corynebacterium aquatimens]|uniref:Thiamine-monophosphate kinase n=1 Tax=Corynebacterium aquatimens TaxID=1190508 RepID=A0A931DWD1_9CORY|nr:thiamine-phosphate kinase [Corynebacterium aquatimens]MBG6121457.1 thiamine-monophosphate kinase [Corynebacterium aquatimens]WJY65999.1 Thiamine-monophosphate kinase [Corynebacterium aquatimens]
MPNTGFPTQGPTLRELGEKEVIRRITHAAPSAVNGDDAAVLYPASPNSRVVATTDMLVEGRHFRRDLTTPRLLGRRAVTQNFADVEAMGARPIAVLLSLSAPMDLPVDVLTEFAGGIAEEIDGYAAELVGGDVTAGQNLVISITAIGSLGGNRPPLTLDGARAGQQVIAHGAIGYSAAGLALLESGLELPDEFAPLIEGFQTPTIRPGSGVVARSAGASSMTDNSDGLIVDISTLAERSRVNIDLDKEAIAPDELLLAAGELVGIDPWKWVLEGGEDHTLMGTIHGEAPVGFRVIGQVAKDSKDHKSNGERAGVVTVDGQPPAFRQGWESFA